MPRSTTEPLAVRSTVEAAAEWLRDSIMRGDLKPGERLVEHKLAATLGIGQPTLREALKELELLGFVRKIPKKGTRVTKLTKDDFRDILEVRMALESVAIERAAVRMDSNQLAALRACVDGMEVAAGRFDLAEFHRHDVEFHRILWEAADNGYLSLALERTAFGLFAFVLLQRQPEAATEFLSAVKQHRRMLQGLKSGDPEEARRAFVESTLEFWNESHDLEARYPSDSPAGFAQQQA